VPALAVFVALVAGLRAPLARDARLAFGFAILSVINRPCLLDVSQVALGVHPRPVHILTAVEHGIFAANGGREPAG
jgi:hypothetical protein